MGESRARRYPSFREEYLRLCKVQGINPSVAGSSAEMCIDLGEVRLTGYWTPRQLSTLSARIRESQVDLDPVVKSALYENLFDLYMSDDQPKPSEGSK